MIAVESEMEARESFAKWNKSLRVQVRSCRSIEQAKETTGLIIDCAIIHSAVDFTQNVDVTSALQCAVNQSTSSLSLHSIAAFIEEAPIQPKFECNAPDGALHIRWRVGHDRFIGEWRCEESVDLGLNAPRHASTIALSQNAGKRPKPKFIADDPFW